MERSTLTTCKQKSAGLVLIGPLSPSNLEMFEPVIGKVLKNLVVPTSIYSRTSANGHLP